MFHLWESHVSVVSGEDVLKEENTGLGGEFFGDICPHGFTGPNHVIWEQEFWVSGVAKTLHFLAQLPNQIKK